MRTKKCNRCYGRGQVMTKFHYNMGDVVYPIICPECLGNGYIAGIAHLEEHLSCKEDVEGSSPSVGSKEEK